MSRIVLKSYSIHDDPSYFTLKALHLLGINSSRGYTKNIAVVSSPGTDPSLFARLNPPYHYLPPLDAMNSGEGNLTGLKGKAGMYRIYARYVDPADGQTKEWPAEMLDPDHPAVVAGFANLKAHTDMARVFIADSTAASTEPTTLRYVLRKGADVLFSTEPEQTPSGASTVIPPQSYSTAQLATVSIPQVNVLNSTTPIGIGQTFSVQLLGTRAIHMHRGLPISRSLGTPAEAKALLNMPAEPTDLCLYLDVRFTEGYGYDVVPTPDVFNLVLPLGPYISRVSDFVVRGTGSPVVEYRVAPFVNWVSVDTPSDLPIQDATTGQLYSHTVELRVKLDTPEQKFTGLSFNITEGEDFAVAIPPTTDFSALKPLDWKEGTKLLRSMAYGKLVARHPLMPVGMGGLVAYNQAGTRVYPQRRGELLCFESSGPFTVYWNQESDGMPVPTIGESTYLTTHAQAARGYWGATEEYLETRSVVIPRYQLSIGGIDFTSHVVDFSQDSVTIAGPASVFENIPASVQNIQVSGPSQPIFTGRAVRTDTRPFANGRMVTFRVMFNTEFYDVDLSRVNLESDTIPTGEDSYVKRTLERAGFMGDMLVAPGVQWRNTGFWQAPLPAGPGMELSEVESRYQNTQNSSTLASIKMVLQANMLDIYDLPGGEVMVDRILPQVESTLPELLKSAPFVYCSSGGKYVNDPRINVTGVNLALDENFNETEVEGFSNEVNLGIGKGLANFVQAYKQNNYLERSVGGYQTDAYWSDNPFQTMENGALRHEFFPVEWYAQAQLNVDSSVIEVERVYQSGGFGGTGNKNVTSKSLVVLNGTQAAARWPAAATEVQQFVDQFLPSLDTGEQKRYDTPQKRMENSRLVVGIEATANGDYVSKATFHFKVNVGRPQEALINVVPLEGKFDARWAPDWFPPWVALQMVQTLRDLKPRTTRKVSNPMIARIGSQYAVQKPNYRDGRITAADYDNNWATTANQLATWLTIKDLLKTRRVEVSLAGAQAVNPNQFLFIARRPPGGPGAAIEHVDVLLILEPGRPDARVGSEAWTRLSCAYVGTVSNNEATYDMPIGWGVVWQEG